MFVLSRVSVDYTCPMCVLCVMPSVLDAFSALTPLLVGRQEEHPACKKTEWWGADMVMSGARCRLAYGAADATATH